MPTIDTMSWRSPNHSPRNGMDIDMLVLHATVGKAKSALEWLVNPAPDGDPKLRVSTHYLIDKQGTIYQLVSDALAAWHAGVSSWHGEGHINERSIGIELENKNDGKDPYPPAQIQALIWLARTKVQQYAIPQHNVVRHMDVAPGRKSDPAGFPFAEFVTTVYGKPPASDEQRYIYKVPWYIRWKRANVRREPTTKAPIVGYLYHNDIVRGVLEKGEPYDGDDRWVRLTIRRGYVWYGNLERVSDA